MGVCFGGESMKVTRVLILGIAACGKSTFLKQLRFMATGSFGENELLDYKELALQNMVSGIQELIQQGKKLEIEVSQENRKHCRSLLQTHSASIEANEELYDRLKILWKDEAIQTVWNMKNTFSMQIKHLDYMMDNIERMSQADYVPTKEDILLLRQRTTGIVKINFSFDKLYWEFIDVGGQKSEREKWGPVIEQGIDCVVFIAALDEYAMSSSDEGKTNMRLAIEVFQEVMQSEGLKNKPKLLFLNKLDIFKKQLTGENGWAEFKKVFSDFNSEDIEAAQECVTKEFVAVAGGTKLDSVLVGTLLEVDYVSTIYRTMQKSILSASLLANGLIELPQENII